MEDNITPVNSGNMNQNKKKSDMGAAFIGGLIIGALVAILIGCTVVLGLQLQKVKDKVSVTEQISDTTSDSKEAQIKKMEDKIEALLAEIDKEYYKDDVDMDALADGIYHGLMEAVGDPYTRYYSVEEFEEFMEDATGEYSGIGAYVKYDTELKYPVISKPIEGSPAEEAGLLPEDIIAVIDGESVYDIGDLDKVVGMIKGPEGTTVDVTILRGEKKEKINVTLERRKVEVDTVRWKMLEDAMAYIQIDSFDDVTPTQFESALSNCEKEGMKGLVLDLRGNPGGNLTSVLAIARQMLPEGLIVYIEDKYGKQMRYECKGEHVFEYPMVVLIDGGSASAAELLSGAIQDYGIGTLIGTTSFGKGIVQDIIRMNDGSAIKITTSSYYTPKGRNIHGTGIEPDITCEFDAESYLKDGYDNQLEKAKEELKKKMK